MSTANPTITSLLRRAPQDDVRRVSYSLLATSRTRKRKTQGRSRFRRFWEKLLG